MSGNHFEVRKAVSRGKGQSVVAKAAYNARTQLDNERFGEKTANYGRKENDEVAFSGIFVDPKLNAPERIQDRNRYGTKRPMPKARRRTPARDKRSLQLCPIS